jgi:hypothetical protein
MIDNGCELSSHECEQYYPLILTDNTMTALTPQAAKFCHQEKQEVALLFASSLFL